MAEKEKFKVLTESEYKALNKEEKKEYNKELKNYKKFLKEKKKKSTTKFQRKMAFIRFVGLIIAILFALGILASIFSPLIYR